MHVGLPVAVRSCRRLPQLASIKTRAQAAEHSAKCHECLQIICFCLSLDFFSCTLCFFLSFSLRAPSLAFAHKQLFCCATLVSVDAIFWRQHCLCSTFFPQMTPLGIEDREYSDSVFYSFDAFVARERESDRRSSAQWYKLLKLWNCYRQMANFPTVLVIINSKTTK